MEKNDLYHYRPKTSKNVAYETLATPLTYLVVNFLKKKENEDYFDRNTDFNPISF